MSCFRLAARCGEPGAPGLWRSGKRFPAGRGRFFPDGKPLEACLAADGRQASHSDLAAGGKRQRADGTGTGREDRAKVFGANVRAASSLSRFFSSVSLCAPEKSGREDKRNRKREKAARKARNVLLPDREAVRERRGWKRRSGGKRPESSGERWTSRFHGASRRFSLSVVPVWPEPVRQSAGFAPACLKNGAGC